MRKLGLASLAATMLWCCACTEDESVLAPPFDACSIEDCDPDWSPDGTSIAYTHIDRSDPLNEPSYRIWILNIVTAEKHFVTYGWWPAWSPDGVKIAFVSGTYQNSQVCVVDVDTGEVAQLTTRGSCLCPCWSPDGAKLAYDLDVGDSSGIWIMNADGSEKTRALTGRIPDWAPGGATLAYHNRPTGPAIGTESQIWTACVDGSNPDQLTERGILNHYPRWSPDGLQIAWNSIGEGRYDPDNGIWVMNADGSGQHQVVYDEYYGGRPSWSPDGSKIVYPGYNKDSDTVNLWVVNADGTDPHPLTTAEDYE
jgi:TolB protein